MWKKTELNGCVVMVTGATSGIGRAIALGCAREGARLLICGRRRDRLDEVAREARSLGSPGVWAQPLDVRNRPEVQAWWQGVPEEFRQVQVLVNSAGLARGLSNFRDNDADEWDEMIDTNLTGLLSVTRAILPTMVAANRGHIVNIGSLAGVAAYPKGGVYCATKAAVKTLTDGIRQDLVDTAIRVTNIQPGMVETEFSVVRFHGDQDKADGFYKGIVPLTADDIAETVLFALLAPPHVQICELTVTPTHQATGGVVYKA